MAGTKSKTQTKVSERQVPADSVPTARRARMQKLGTYILQGPSADPNRLMPVAEIAERAYKIMDEERGIATAPVKVEPVVEMDTAEVDNAMDTTMVAPSKSEQKRIDAQKKARAKQSKRDKAKKEAKILPEAASDVRPGVTQPEASEVGTEPEK
jgi:hypothetical protein